MARYEYLTVTIAGSPVDISRVLNRRAGETWELVCVDDGRAYFRRLVTPSPLGIIDKDGLKVEFEQ